MLIALGIAGAFALLVVLGCCKVSGDCTREEEKQEMQRREEVNE